MPLVQHLLELIHHEKVIGDVHRIFCDFGLPIDVANLPATSRLKNPELGAGSLLDIGIYSLTWGLLVLDDRIAGEASTPQVFSAQSISDDIDIATAVILYYPQTGRQGILTSTLRVKTESVFARIEGSEGTITIEGVAASAPSQFTVIPRDPTAQPKVYRFPHIGKGFFYEADAVAQDIAAGRVENAVMPWGETRRVMALMDGIRKRGGAHFPQDRTD
ncbi:hypothetical protein VTN96DRAFT_6674 [Rasamsonia emersonii]